MKAVLLAAGKGTRLRPLTDDTPKVMIPVNGKPLLEHHIERLTAAGVRDIFINLHHLPGKIKDYFQDGKKWKARIRYSYEREVLGTAGAVGKLREELKDGPFLVIYGDNYLELPYPDYLHRAEIHDGLGTIVVFEKEATAGSGILDIAVDGRILKFLEKPLPEEVFSHWVNAGVYHFRPRILEHIGPGFADFGFDILPRVLDLGEKIYAYKFPGDVWGIDSPELLAELAKKAGGGP